MTIRQYVAMIYGAVALGTAVLVQSIPGIAGADTAIHAAMIRPTAPVAAPLAEVTLMEIEPGLTGHAEFDDLPAYLSGAGIADTGG